MVETHDRFHALAIDLMGVSIVWCIHGAVEFAQEEGHKLFWKRSAIHTRLYTDTGGAQRKGAQEQSARYGYKAGKTRTKRQKGEGTRMQARF